jgi:hypothetical protein
MEKTLSIERRFAEAYDRYTTKTVHELVKPYHEKRKKWLMYKRIHRKYNAENYLLFALKLFNKCLNMIYEDLIDNADVFETPTGSYLYVGNFPKHKTNHVIVKQQKRENYYKDMDFTLSPRIKSVKYKIKGEEKYIKIPRQYFNRLMKNTGIVKYAE